MPLEGSVERSEHSVEASSGITLHAIEKRLSRTHAKGAVLLIHGVGVGHECWDLGIRDYSLMDLLAREGFDVFAVNQRGYGKSTKSESLTIRCEESAHDLEFVVDYIRKLRSFDKLDVVGHSFGGMVATYLATRRSEQVDQLVLVGCPYKEVGSGFRPAAAQLAKLAREGVPFAPNLHYVALDQRLHSFDQDVLDAYKDLVSRLYPEWPTSVFLELETLSHSRFVKSISCPTLIIYGTLDHVVDPVDMVQCLNDLGSEKKSLLVVGNTGHLIWLEKTSHRKVYQAIADWLLP